MKTFITYFRRKIINFKRSTKSQIQIILFSFILIAPSIVIVKNVLLSKHSPTFSFKEVIINGNKRTAFIEKYIESRKLIISYMNYFLYKSGLRHTFEQGKYRITVGKSGWMFFSGAMDTISHYRGIDSVKRNKTENFVRSAYNKFLKIQNYNSSKGINTYFIIIPTKPVIYPEYLPNWANKINQSKIELFLQLNSSSRKKLKIYYLNEYYNDLKQKDIEIYSPYDFHANILSAYYTWEYIKKIMTDDGVIRKNYKIKSRKIKRYTTVNAWGDDPARMVFPDRKIIHGQWKKPELEYFSNDVSYIKPDGSEIKRKGNIGIACSMMPYKAVNNKSKNSLSIVYAHNSFGINLSPFIQNDIKTVIHVHRDDLNKIIEAVDKFKPFAVLYVFHDSAGVY